MDLFYFDVPFKNLLATGLSVATGVGGCRYPISDRAVLIEVDFWKFSNYPPNYASVEEAMTFCMMQHSIFMGPLYCGTSEIGVLLFGRGTRKNILSGYCVTLVQRGKKLQNKVAGSCRFSYTPSLILFLMSSN